VLPHGKVRASIVEQTSWTAFRFEKREFTGQHAPFPFIVKQNNTVFANLITGF